MADSFHLYRAYFRYPLQVANATTMSAKIKPNRIIQPLFIVFIFSSNVPALPRRVLPQITCPPRPADGSSRWFAVNHLAKRARQKHNRSTDYEAIKSQNRPYVVQVFSRRGAEARRQHQNSPLRLRASAREIKRQPSAFFLVWCWNDACRFRQPS
jgi:hypothetical protein